MLDYNFYSNKVGTKFSIINGELVEDVSGNIVVSETLLDYSIYISNLEKRAFLVIPDTGYIGKTYKLRTTDCISICCKWHDNTFNTTLQQVYKNTSHSDFKKYFKDGMNLWFETNNFIKTNTLSIGSFIVYEYKPNITSHIAIYIDTNKILHHIPWKLSSIDALDNSKILGIYNYKA